MKRLIIFSSGLLATTFLHADNQADFEGTFEFEHEITMAYENAEACQADGGRWESEEDNQGYCVVKTSDSVDISSEGEGENATLSVAVSTVSSNAHLCEFQSEGGRQVSPTEWIATAAGQHFVTDETTGEGRIEEGTCEVTVTMIDADNVSVSASEMCQSFCGVNAYLIIDKATRVSEAQPQ